MSDKTIVVYVGRRVPKCLTELGASHFGGGTWMFRCEVNDPAGWEKWREKHIGIAAKVFPPDESTPKKSRKSRRKP